MSKEEGLNEVYLKLSRQLSAARKLRRLTQQNLADLSGVGRVTISRIESCPEASLPGTQLETLARILLALNLEHTLLGVASITQDAVGQGQLMESLPSRVNSGIPSLTGRDL